MKQQVYLSLIFHNHQPVGNFDFVFREAFEKSYLPLIQALERHPAVSAAMHFSGPLRDWLLVNEPAYYLEAVGALVSRGQLELLGGAYYEPILVMLDDADKIGQLHKLSDAVEGDFGVRPRGMWLAERVWEPYLAKPIAQAGLAYTVVDDTHFHFAGFRDEDLYGYYVTEEQGWPLRIIPAPKFMRNSLPWRPVEDFLDELRRLGLDESTSANRLFTMADDGEKFGLWPGTYRRCWQDGYIDELFTALADASDWLRTVTPSEYLDQFPALGRAYMPAASYLEMTEWALPAAGAAALPAVRKRLAQEATRTTLDPELASDLVEVQHYLRGGLWRNFLVKYPEANHMQKRCNYISHRLRQMPEGEAKDEALAHLWAAQCNCGYWHGVFGGIYLFHIRVANYQNLLQSLTYLLDETVQVEQLDFDLDGANELVINSDLFSLVIDPAYGGAIFEWDDVPSRYNVPNVIARRREGYHIRLEEAAANDAVITPEHPDWDRPQGHQARAKALGLERELVVDWHRRGMLIDHFLHSETTLESFSHVEYEEQADFVAQPYAVDIEETDPWQAVVTLSRNGAIRQADGPHRGARFLAIARGIWWHWRRPG